LKSFFIENVDEVNESDWEEHTEIREPFAPCSPIKNMKDEVCKLTDSLGDQK